MKKMNFAIALAGFGLMVSCSGAQEKGPAQSLKLDPTASKIVATAMKNEIKAVPVTFSSLGGWADPATGQAHLYVPIKKLSTGDAARDANLTSLFFEVAKAADFGKAEFILDSLAGGRPDLSKGSVETKGKGRLKLHGTETALEGPLALQMDGAKLTVSLKPGWAIAIDQAGMAASLAQLNAHCPQPHRVANQVTLSGELLFVP